MLSCLFIAALWSPAGKGLTSWFSCMWCFLVLLPLSHEASWVRCGTWLYHFLIFAFFLLIFLTFRNKEFFHHLSRTEVIKWPLHTSMFWKGLTTMTPTKVYKAIIVINHLPFIQSIFLSWKCCLLFTSAAYIQVHFRLDFIIEANTRQTKEQIVKVVTGGKGLKLLNMHLLHHSCRTGFPILSKAPIHFKF